MQSLSRIKNHYKIPLRWKPERDFFIGEIMKAYGIERGSYRCCGSGYGTSQRHHNCVGNKYGNDENSAWSRDAIKRKNRRAKKKARQKAKKEIRKYNGV
jgi:hypothetical protein